MRMRKGLLVLAVTLALIAVGMAGPAMAAKPTIMKGCKSCHDAKPDIIRGKLVKYSPKFKSIQVDVGPLVWIIKYDDATQFKGTEDMAQVNKGKEMAVTFTGSEDNPMATVVSIKQPFEIPEDQLVSVEEMKEMVRSGLKGVILVDSRPPDAYNSGHIPGAKNIPFPKLKKMKEQVLPKEKDANIVFYCGGFA